MTNLKLVRKCRLWVATIIYKGTTFQSSAVDVKTAMLGLEDAVRAYRAQLLKEAGLS